MMMCSQRCRQLYTTVFVLCAFLISSPLMSQTTADSQPVAKIVAAYPQVFSRQSDQTASDGTLNNRQTVGAGVINTDPVTAIAGLLLVVLLIFAIAWLIRRLGGVPMMGGQAMKVNAVLSVGTREKVVLVDVGDKQVLLGVAPGRVTHLDSFDQPVVGTGNRDTDTADFSSTIKAVLQKARHRKDT